MNKTIPTETDVSESTSRMRSLENTETTSKEDDVPPQAKVNFNSTKSIPALSLGKEKK